MRVIIGLNLFFINLLLDGDFFHRSVKRPTLSAITRKQLALERDEVNNSTSLDDEEIASELKELKVRSG